MTNKTFKSSRRMENVSTLADEKYSMKLAIKVVREKKMSSLKYIFWLSTFWHIYSKILNCIHMKYIMWTYYDAYCVLLQFVKLNSLIHILASFKCKLKRKINNKAHSFVFFKKKSKLKKFRFVFLLYAPYYIHINIHIINIRHIHMNAIWNLFSVCIPTNSNLSSFFVLFILYHSISLNRNNSFNWIKSIIMLSLQWHSSRLIVNDTIIISKFIISYRVFRFVNSFQQVILISTLHFTILTFPSRS